MADTIISLLPAAGVLTGAEIVPIVQSGATKRETLAQIASFSGFAEASLAYVGENIGAKAFYPNTLLMYDPSATFLSKFANSNTAARTYTLPNASGTIALLSDITGGSGITINATAITGGTTARLLFDKAGVVGETPGITYDNATSRLNLNDFRLDLAVGPSAGNIQNSNGGVVFGRDDSGEIAAISMYLVPALSMRTDGYIGWGAGTGVSGGNHTPNAAFKKLAVNSIAIVNPSSSDTRGDLTLREINLGIAGNGVILRANSGELYLRDEAGSSYANFNVNQVYSTYRILCDRVETANGSHSVVGTFSGFTYSGFRARSGATSGMWWSSSVLANDDASIETGIVREAVGTLAVSLAAGGYGDFKAKDFIVGNVVKLKTFTVATLPSPATSGVGATAFATDAITPTPLAAVVGGGSTKVPVYCDGATWLVG